MQESGSRSLVLAVDDDPVALRVVTRLLERDGYEVVAKTCAEDAQVAFGALHGSRFDCIVTDYHLPGLNGVDLSAWIRMYDPTISAILVTSEGEQNLVEQSLRAGFADFLNKPISAAELLAAVARASAATLHKREMANMERSLKQAGITQKRLLHSEFHGRLLDAQIYTRPIHQAGGDAFSHIQISPDEEVILLADVSGHDLSAAYASAHFQGMVRGMLESGKDLPAVLHRINRFLTEEWSAESDAGLSISTCSLQFDARSNEVSIANCGPPLVVYTSPEGTVDAISESNSYPLGWFSDNPIAATRRTFTGGVFTLWTDGLSDLADVLGVSCLSLVHGLLMPRMTDDEPSWLSMAADDIMVVRVQLKAQPQAFFTLIDESYGAAEESRINELQNAWRTSISVALMGDVTAKHCGFLYDATLCAREAVLNALRYGCKPGETVHFRVLCNTQTGILQIYVSDPGPGHSFDPAMHETPEFELIEEHRGLLLIRALAAHLLVERNGAELTMDFYWKDQIS